MVKAQEAYTGPGSRHGRSHGSIRRNRQEYRDFKQLPFREHVERYTLFQLIGGVRGKAVLDIACGRGLYTRLLERAGAAEVTGVDISREMIRLAEDEERRHPIGCKYAQADVAAFEPSRPVDRVVAMYLLNYARSGEQFRRFCQVCRDAMRPGGGSTVSTTTYGISSSEPLRCRNMDWSGCARIRLPRETPFGIP